MSTPPGKPKRGRRESRARLQQFLDRAAPLLSAELDPASVDELRTLAEQLGVSAAEVRDLLVRLVKKGTLPQRQMETVLERWRGDAGPRDPGANWSGEDEIVVIDDSTPQPPKPPPLPKSSHLPKPVANKDRPRSVTPPPPPEPAEGVRPVVPTPPALPNSLPDAFAQLGARPEPVPVPEVFVGGPDAREDFAGPSATESPAGRNGDSSADAATETTDEPSRPKKLPREAFGAYVHRAIRAMSTRVISTKKEAKLVAEGEDKLGLSSAFARSIVWDVAAERDVPVLSQQTLDEEDTAAERAQSEGRLESFMERAASIIAEQRGINVKSRMLMEAVAQELGLDAEEFEQGIGLLQGRGRAKPGAQERLEQACCEGFGEHVCRSLEKLPRGILTAPGFDEIVETGELYHGVESKRAEAMIREAAREADIRYISKEQAIHHIADLITDKMSGATRLTADVKQRIFSEGEQWGLSADEMDDVLRDCVAVSRKQRAKSRGISSAAMALACLAVFALLGVAGWAFLHAGSNAAPVEPGIGSGGVGLAGGGSPGGAGATEPKDDPTWLDRDLQVAVTRARILLRDQKDTLETIREGDAEQRRDAYEKLFTAKLAAVRADREDSILSVLAGAYAIEPSEENATKLRESIVRLASPAEGNQVTSVEHAEARLWAVRTAIASMRYGGVSDVRADLLARELGRVLGIVVNRSVELAAIESHCLGAVCKQTFRSLTSVAQTTADGVTEMYEYLSRRADQYLDPEELEQLETNFLMAVFQRSEGDWPDYEELIRRTADSEDPYTVLKLVEIFENAEDSRLRLMLAGLLLRRTDLLSKPITMGEVAAEVRKALGVKRRTSQKERWEQFDTHVSKALAAVSATDEDHDKLISEIVELTYLSTLGCALSRGELGQSSFDVQVAEGYELPDTGAAPPPLPTSRRGGRPIVETTQAWLVESVQRTIGMIAASSRPEQRVTLVGRLAEQADKLKVLAPGSANVLARYLVEPKSQQEHELITPHIKKLSRWSYVRLAMVDELEGVSSPDDQINETLAQVLGREFTERDAERWKRQVRGELLQSVLSELNPAGSRGTTPAGKRQYDRLMQSVLERLLEQAKVLGVPAEATRESVRPSQALAALINLTVTQVSGRPLSVADQRFLKQLPHHATAIDFLAENDVALTIMRQRLWLRLLSIRVSQDRPEQRSAAEQLVDELEELDSKAQHLLVQLRDGELRLVAMWRLLVQPK